jgi:glycosyltransferase involved in cell wall biosynthesis
VVIQFSICLPVRNGWPYVRECVDSILRQTYPHFELHVLDNQSTDNTMHWLTTLRDPRVRIWRSPKSLSIVDSWARISTIEKKEFMTLIGHDDILDPGFLSAVKKLINRNPDAGLYLTGGRLINSEGKTIRSCRPVPQLETAAGYLKGRFIFQRDVFGTGYVMRSADYDRLGGIPCFEKLFFADDALWLSMMRNSYKATESKEYFSVRIHPGSESASLPSAWTSILVGLRQFNDFLQNYNENDAASRSVTETFGPPFMLAYHRNVYIFALVNACQSGKRISPDTVARIRSSLAVCAPAIEGDLRRSIKVAIIEAFNASPLRALIPLLWDACYRLKNKA